MTPSSSHDSGERHYPSDHSPHETFYPPDEPYDNDNDDDDGDDGFTRDYPDERSSPTEHDVSGYTRQQNGKTVNVRPYKRGGK